LRPLFLYSAVQIFLIIAEWQAMILSPDERAGLMATKNENLPCATVRRKISAQQLTTFCLLVAALLFMLLYYLSPSLGARQGNQPSKELKAFLDAYFSTWSSGDMKGYQALFHANARIAYLLDGRVVCTLERDPFVAQQKHIRETSGVTMTERMLSCDVLEDKKSASVSARWELKEGDKITVGTDRYSVIRDPAGEWKIVSLLFYKD
jgi:hypothetical protein